MDSSPVGVAKRVTRNGADTCTLQRLILHEHATGGASPGRVRRRYEDITYVVGPWQFGYALPADRKNVIRSPRTEEMKQPKKLVVFDLGLYKKTLECAQPVSNP